MNETYPGTPAIPIRLKVIAILFLLNGIGSAITMLLALFQSGVSIEFGILGIPIFWGLLKLRPGWRTCALVFTWFGLVLLPMFAIWMLFSNGPTYFTLFGLRVMQISRIWPSLGSIIFFTAAIWQYKVLTEPKIKRLFGIA